MIKGKNARVAVLSLTSRAIALLAAPITLLVISKELSVEELAFYYTFFSIIAMQQLAELGIGHVMKQYISHAYIEKTGEWLDTSKSEIKGYFKFSLFWFFGVAVFILSVVGVSGDLYLSLSESSIDWRSSWWMLVLVSSIATLSAPVKLFLDGIQKQETLLKANTVSALSGSVVLWICLMNGVGLNSIALSTLATVSVFVLMTSPTLLRTIKLLKGVVSTENQKSVLRKILPLLTRVSIVWGFGFLFWNSFNLVSFAVLEPDAAGKVIFAIALAKAGFGIAESITQGQSTILSNLIANDNKEKAVYVFSQYQKASIALLLTGYACFFGLWELIPSFYLFDKVPSKEIVLQIFWFYAVLLVMTLKNNFIRCFKIEPFVKQSVLMSSSLPVIYYLSSKFVNEFSFSICSLMIVVMLVVNRKIYKSYNK
ncbi:hypothetical protein [Vibrio owensii]|uniref:hypothetical protein n=1 Tax=Vibrio owensii TaxID=696485 RepID=UPI0018F151F1|nr:hypothetical protein [Vibrio owensii]